MDLDTGYAFRITSKSGTWRERDDGWWYRISMIDHDSRGDRVSRLLSLTQHSNKQLADKADLGYHARVMVRNAERSPAAGEDRILEDGRMAPC